MKMNKKEFVALFAEKANFESKAEARKKIRCIIRIFRRSFS